MAYTVRKLLESEQFPKMKLLCGEKGLDLEVKGIRIIFCWICKIYTITAWKA